MLYVVFSFVFIKYVNDRFLLNLVDRSTLRSHSLPPRLFLLRHPARVTRSLQEVVPSFAVAKVYQIPNTNQILPRKTSENPPRVAFINPIANNLQGWKKFFISYPAYPIFTSPKPSPKATQRTEKATPHNLRGRGVAYFSDF